MLYHLGRLAWVPRRAQAGNMFCVFLGARAPHLLRKASDGRYKLIDECNLQGRMNGEVINANDIALQDFVII
jgi:hypothetical protein